MHFLAVIFFTVFTPVFLLAKEPAREPELKAYTRGSLLSTLTLEKIKESVPPQKVHVFEPHEMHDQEYAGVAINPLLDKIYGSSWRKKDEVLFTCADGYQAAIPAAYFSTYSGYLVYERKDDPTFSITNKHQNHEHVPLGPFYLVWDNIKSAELKKKGAQNWPYQIVGIDLVSFKERYPHSSPPQNSTSTELAGFQVFRAKCMTCHKLNGDGGDKGPELNSPASVTQYWKKDWLEKFIWDPQSVRAGSTMPGMKSMGSKEELKTVLQYLEKMSGVTKSQ